VTRQPSLAPPYLCFAGDEMKVIHVPFCFAPDPFGGTEVYVANLARDLHGVGVDSMVAAPSDTSRAYTIGDLRVRRFATSKVSDVANFMDRAML
jgi:hypothetical protein